ncbi:MAG: hypothetical protein A2Y95_06030 [Deltaproteobacteria bacterium RBG_13_65_10]|nr:MAG: hypothetical protein A2Y95_06030 [Deltaproteobacteria bacterium RBG_13_65_10]
MRLLEIRQSSTPPDRVDAPALVLGFFQDERPLRGAAGMVDWRLNGYVSRLLAGECLSGDSRESTLVATQGRLRPPIVLLVGLGARVHYGFDRITDILGYVTQKLQKLHVEEYALEVPGASLLGLDPAEGAYNAVKGMVKILSPSAAESTRLRVTFLSSSDIAGRLRFGLRKAQSNFQGRVQIALIAP